ncbi:MAG: hypothetical protein ICV68_03385, partial [Pyrinomonadaceae bacterium]|nr:hypothetical protein [Pyrinomonadaceae bacterium]
MKNRKGFILHLLAGVLLLLPSSALAQSTASSQSSSAQQIPTSDELTAGGYEIISTVETGVRGLGIDGNRNKYYSDLNYRAGFRLFDVSILARAKENRGGLFDTLLVNASGFDADPHGNVRVNVEKTRWYKFDVNFRRNAYNNFLACCNLAQVRLPTSANLGQSEHTARTKHNFADFDLKLLPQNRQIRFNFGYTMDRYRGPGTSSVNYARDDYQLNFNPWRSRSDEVRGGFESKIGGLDLAFTQGYRYYRDDSVFTSGPNIGNAGPPGNTSSLTSYYRSTPMRGQAWYSRISAHTQIDKRFDITARYIYTKSTSRFTYTELITGRGTLEGRDVFIDLHRITGFSENVERPTHLFDAGFTWRVTNNLRISETFRWNEFRVDGGLAYIEERFLRNAPRNPPAST